MNDPVQLQLDPFPADWETILDDRGVVERCSIDVSDFDFRRLDFSQGTVTLFGKTLSRAPFDCLLWQPLRHLLLQR